MAVTKLVNPHEHATETQAWCDYLGHGLYEVVYASIDENAKTDDPFKNPSFGAAERDAVNVLIMVAGTIFSQHGCGAYENLARYVDGLKDLLDSMNEEHTDE